MHDFVSHYASLVLTQALPTTPGHSTPGTVEKLLAAKHDMID